MLFTCPKTGKEVKISVEVLGRSFECPSCGQMHLAPLPEPPRAGVLPEAGASSSEGQEGAAAPAPETDAAGATDFEGVIEESVEKPGSESVGGLTEGPAEAAAVMPAQESPKAYRDMSPVFPEGPASDGPLMPTTGQEVESGPGPEAASGDITFERAEPDVSAPGAASPSSSPGKTVDTVPILPGETIPSNYGTEDSSPMPSTDLDPVEPSAQPPAPSRRGGRFVAVLVLLAAVGAGGYIGWRQVQRHNTRLGLLKALAAAKTSHDEGDFVAAYDKALECEAILRDRAWAFANDERSDFEAAVAGHKRALEVITLAGKATARASDGFDDAMAALDRLACDRSVSGDAALSKAIAHFRVQCVLDEAARIAGAEGGDAAEIDGAIVRLNALRRRVSSEEDRARFDEIVSGLITREKRRALRDAFAAAKDAVQLFKDGKVDDAFKRAADAEGALAEFPREIADPAFLEYLADATNVARGKGGESGKRFGVAEADLPAAAQLFTLREMLREAEDVTETAASDIDAALKRLVGLREEALEAKGPNSDAPARAAEAVGALEQEVKGIRPAHGRARGLGREDGGAFLEAIVIRAAMSSPRVRFRTGWVKRGPDAFRAEFRLDGTRGALHAPKGSYKKSALVTVEGHTFIVPWRHFMYRDVIMAGGLAARMRAVGVEPSPSGHWEMVEGPSSPVALLRRGKAFLLCVVGGELAKARTGSGADRGAIDEFTKTARELRESIKKDESIQSDLRQAFDATIAATFGETDPRDWLDPAFCRRIVAEGYIEENLPELGPGHRAILERYRAAYEKLSAGYPVLSTTLEDGRTLTAFGSLEDELSQGRDKAYKRPAYSWRVDAPDGKETTFAVPLPDRHAHPLYVAATFEGRHETQPSSAEPVRLKMLHALSGVIASKKEGAWELEFDQKKWDETLHADAGLFRNMTYGTPGWALPPHVPVLDPNGTPKGILTRQGLLASRDFSGLADPAERLAAEGEYLDECAAKLKTPGELNFLFKYFTKYVFDSPVASRPNVIGNHLATGETHQTAEQFLERKIGGYFVGDCDDVAEFFQVITRRQGKLSHVFSLPKHAACGYVEKRKPPEGEPFRLIFLQTGPARIFEAPTLDEVVEKGVMAFSEDEDQSFTVAAVPFLFRFANEQTRTPYVLSDRIIVDDDYAEIMIRVQSYWHYHYYATAFRTMEELIETDKDISNFTELAGLYRWVGLYEESIKMSRGGLAAMKRSDEKIRQNELIDIATMHYMAGDEEEAKTVLLEIAKQTVADIQARNLRQVFRLMPIRFQAAGLHAMMDDPLSGFRMVEMDINFARRAFGKIIDPLRRALVSIYVAIADREERGAELTDVEKGLREHLSRLLLTDFSTDLFEKDDGFNSYLRHYSLIGSFAVATVGREKAREMLLAEGPYPRGERDHRARGAEISLDDWQWFRICPPVYTGLIFELVEPPPGPHRWLPASRMRDAQAYDPELAIRLIDAMLKGADEGRKLGSMNAMEGILLRGRILKAILRSDLEEFDALLAEVKSKNWDRHFEAAASAFGDLCGLLKLEDVPAWMDVVHRYIPGKQHYFRIAYWALKRGYLDHGLAAAERAVTFFPDEEAMAGELVYFRDLVKRLKVVSTERDERQRPEAPEPEPELEPDTLGPAAPEDIPEPDPAPEAPVAR